VRETSGVLGREAEPRAVDVALEEDQRAGVAAQLVDERRQLACALARAPEDDPGVSLLSRQLGQEPAPEEPRSAGDQRFDVVHARILGRTMHDEK
jgi:hypothetical protein